MEQIIPLGSVKSALKRDVLFTKDEQKTLPEAAEYFGLSLCNPAFPCSMLLEHAVTFNVIPA